jgi:hypothetical protein
MGAHSVVDLALAQDAATLQAMISQRFVLEIDDRSFGVIRFVDSLALTFRDQLANFHHYGTLLHDECSGKANNSPTSPDIVLFYHLFHAGTRGNRAFFMFLLILHEKDCIPALRRQSYMVSEIFAFVHFAQNQSRSFVAAQKQETGRPASCNVFG